MNCSVSKLCTLNIDVQDFEHFFAALLTLPRGNLLFKDAWATKNTMKHLIRYHAAANYVH